MSDKYELRVRPKQTTKAMEMHQSRSRTRRSKSNLSQDQISVRPETTTHEDSENVDFIPPTYPTDNTMSESLTTDTDTGDNLAMLSSDSSQPTHTDQRANTVTPPTDQLAPPLIPADTLDTVPARFETPATHDNSQSDLLSQIAALIQNSGEQLNAEIRSVQQNLDSKMDNIQQNMNSVQQNLDSVQENMSSNHEIVQHELREYKAAIEDRIAKLCITQEQTRIEIEAIRSLNAQQSQNVTDLEKRLTESFESNDNKTREQFLNEMQSQRDSFYNLVREESAKTNEIVKERINISHKQLSNQIAEEHDKLAENVKSNHERIECEILPKILTHAHQLEEQKQCLTELKETISSQTGSNYNNQAGERTIYVNCSGKTSPLPDLALPKFNGRAHNPQEYLRRLKKYVDKLTSTNPAVDPTELLCDTLEISLENHASRWFYLIKSDVTDWYSFETLFEEKYWSRDVQRGIRQRLEMEKYRPNGKQTRSEYFTERAIVLKSMQPPMSEDELVIFLADHFDNIVQDARRVQNVNSIRDFGALLQREDQKDAHIKLQHRQRSPQQNRNWETQNPRGNRNNQPAQPSHPQVDFHAYQQRRDRQPEHGHYAARHAPYQRYDDRNRRPFENRRSDFNPRPHQRPPSPRRNSPPRGRNYPTTEQQKTCAAIRTTCEDVDNPPSTSQQANGKHLN